MPSAFPSRAQAVRVALQMEGRGRRMALRGLGSAGCPALPVDRRNAASCVPCGRFAPASERGGFSPLRRCSAQRRAGFGRSTQGARIIPALGWLQGPAFTTGSSTLDHTRPRAVEHRDCPPCGGDRGSISRLGRAPGPEREDSSFCGICRGNGGGGAAIPVEVFGEVRPIWWFETGSGRARSSEGAIALCAICRAGARRSRIRP